MEYFNVWEMFVFAFSNTSLLFLVSLKEQCTPVLIIEELTVHIVNSFLKLH